MKYLIQNGIVRKTICGQNILISTLEARKVCPYLTQLNESSAFIWDMLEKGITTEKMIDKIVQEYEITNDEAQKSLQTFLDNMEEQHFIMRKIENE